MGIFDKNQLLSTTLILLNKSSRDTIRHRLRRRINYEQKWKLRTKL